MHHEKQKQAHLYEKTCIYVLVHKPRSNWYFQFKIKTKAVLYSFLNVFIKQYLLKVPEILALKISFAAIMKLHFLLVEILSI